MEEQREDLTVNFGSWGEKWSILSLRVISWKVGCGMNEKRDQGSKPQEWPSGDGEGWILRQQVTESFQAVSRQIFNLHVLSSLTLVNLRTYLRWRTSSPSTITLFHFMKARHPSHYPEFYHGVMSQGEETWGGEDEDRNSGTIQNINIYLIGKYISNFFILFICLFI